MRHDDWFNITRLSVGAAAALTVTLLDLPRAQAPPQQQQQQQQQNPPGQPPAGQRGGGQRGGGRGGVQVLTLSTTAWTDGGTIPIKHSQAGRDVSPPLTWGDPQWTTPPQGDTSFVLLVHDLDAVNGDGATTPLHWLVWNIPGSSRSLPEGVPHGGEMPSGARQISQSGPYYRGPAAPATGAPHHYAFELYLIEGTIDVPAVGAAPAATRTAVWAAMAGKIRGKATLTGTFKRN
jgi:Raf kinase inhibitor-like YbhB/YbcL family protein